MTSRHLVDPELLPLVDQYQGLELSQQTLEALRSMSREILPMFAAPPTSTVTREQRRIPGPQQSADVRVLVYSPVSASANRPALLYLHGGGHVSGSAELCDARCTWLADQLGCIVVSVDYRLAPETVFPGSLEDCYAALQWLRARSDELGIDHTRIAIAGESSGGGLAASLAQLARDRGFGPIVLQVLVYPMLDDRTGSTPASNAFAGEFVWNSRSNQFCWTCLLGHAPDRDNTTPYAVPARTADLKRLPPAFIAVGSLDLFVDESVEYANRLMQAGVSTELHVYSGAVHAFDQVADAQTTVAFQRDLRAALQRALGADSMSSAAG